MLLDRLQDVVDVISYNEVLLESSGTPNTHERHLYKREIQTQALPRREGHVKMKRLG